MATPRYFEQIASTSPDIIFIFDCIKRRKLYCNARITDILGYAPEEFIGLDMLQPDGLIHPDDFAGFVQWLRQAMSTTRSSEVFEHQHRCRHKDGSWRWLRVRSAVFERDEGGRPLQLIGTASDITVQIETHAALERQTTIFHRILNSMSEGVIVCDKAGELLLVNQSAKDMLKLDALPSTLSQIAGVHNHSPAEGATLPSWHSHPLSRALQGEKVAECELSLYDRAKGLALTLSHAAAPLQDAEGQILGAVDVFRDVTENRRALLELQRAEEHFRLLVEGTTDYAIFMLDKAGCVVSWNPGAERILGYRKQEIIGRHVSAFYTPEDLEKGEPARKLEQALHEGRSEEDSWRLRKDGQRFWCTGVVGALHDADGRVKGFVEIMRDNTERRLAEQNVFFLANHDPLTGLPNRARFLERLHEAVLYADRDSSRVAVLLLDLDRFKIINDTLGHFAGDQLLKQVAQRLCACVRETDTVARLGGDEFVVILTRLKSLAAAELVAENIVSELAKPFTLDGHSITSGASVGIAMYPTDGRETGDLLQKADLAMYRAKATGRNRYRVFSPGMMTEIQLRQQQEAQLRSAIREGAFDLVYQPQIDVHSLELIGVEALLRCREGASLGLSTRHLIAMAEEIGVIVELGQWVIRAVCAQAVQWRGMGLPEFKIAINVSRAQLMSADFIGFLKTTLEHHQLPGSLLEIELKESALVDASECNSQVLDALKELGVSISIDDFGTGMSTLSYLKDFPVDVLKLDPALVRNLPKDQEDAAIVSAIIKLAKDLHIKVVAEGVETAEQLSYLRSTPCHIVQGFLFSEAIRPERFEQLLQNRKRKGQIFH